jgi:hypothetical protein
LCHNFSMPTRTLSTRDRLISRLHKQGSLSRRDLDSEGVHPRWLRRLRDEGVIERVRAGVYRAAEAPETTDQGLFEACAAVPSGIVCMTSALAYHKLSTVNPSRIEMAIPRDHWKPVVEYPPIRFYEFRDMTTGLEHVRGHGRAELSIFNPERSICDAFRLRHEIGKDIALEALQNYLRRRSGRRVEGLMRIARVTGVLNIIRPYVEALV